MVDKGVWNGISEPGNASLECGESGETAGASAGAWAALRSSHVQLKFMQSSATTILEHCLEEGCCRMQVVTAQCYWEKRSQPSLRLRHSGSGQK